MIESESEGERGRRREDREGNMQMSEGPKRKREGKIARDFIHGY